MQVRARGNRYQLIRTEYIPEKKRTVGRVVDSLDGYMPTLTDKVREKLSAEELEQVEEKLVDIRHQQIEQEADQTLAKLDELVSLASLALSGNKTPTCLSKDKARLVYESIDELERRLRKHGFKKRDLTRSELSADKKKPVSQEEKPSGSNGTS